MRNGQSWGVTIPKGHWMGGEVHWFRTKSQCDAFIARWLRINSDAPVTFRRDDRIFRGQVAD